MNRQHALDAIASPSAPFDIAIVGGGATGLGAAVDAASRGYRVVLIEQADFAKGTSSRSTKLVHGGVRYLRQGNISLVLEALRERGLLCRNAPHLVRHLAFVIPNYSWWEAPFYGVGMKLYDGLAGRLGLSPSRHLSRDETLARIPNVETDGLLGAIEYHDAQFDDARLAVNLAQTAAAQGAVVANYVKCVGLRKSGGAIDGVLAEDVETGRQLEIRAKLVVNATGVFVDDLRRQDDPDTSAIVAVSQGVHLILPKSFLPGDAAIMIPKTQDGRVLFAVPWRDRVVLGTTDTPLATRSLEPRATQEERDFLLEHAARYLARDPTEDDVLSVFAGLRPLVSAGDSKDTAALSRDHRILVSESGLVTVTGGKWTTYRKMAEDVVDHAEMLAGLSGRPCQTRELPIFGATDATSEQPELAFYGSEAARIQKILCDRPGAQASVHPRLSLSRAEVIHHARAEMARTVEDVLARRSRCLLLDARASIDAAPEVAALLAAELGRDEGWIASQVREYTALAQGYDFKHPSSVASQ